MIQELDPEGCILPMYRVEFSSYDRYSLTLTLAMIS